MKQVELYARVRYAVQIEGISKRAAACKPWDAPPSPRVREPHQPVVERAVLCVALSAKVLYRSSELFMIFRIGLKGKTFLNGFPGLLQTRRTCHGAHRMFEHRAAGHNPKVDASQFFVQLRYRTCPLAPRRHR